MLFHTQDGGRSWEIQVNSRMNDIFFINENEGWFVGDDGKILKYSNNNKPTAISKNNLLPDNYYLSQNFPNSFNPSTIIEYHVSSRENVILKAYDVLGKEVKTLVNESKSPGKYKVYFDASEHSNGVYFYSLIAGDYSETKKMLLIK